MESIKDLNIKYKKVLLRCDFNVPLDNQGNILDDFRIKKTLPTIKYLLSNKAKIILISHLGEPNGNIIPNLKLDKVKSKLEELLNISMVKSNDCIGSEVKNQVLNLKSNQILLLENLRFHKEETGNDLKFAKQLADFGDIYINDAFSDCHRKDASIISVPKYLSSGAGLLLQSEIKNLTKILKNPQKPFLAIIGGIKVETKAKFVEKILVLADFVIVNGPIKKEIILKKIKFKKPKKIIYPTDNLNMPDISQNTIKIFKEKILTAKTIVWNGPFGRFEDERYKKGTLEIAKAIIKSKAFSVVGGGETIEFLNKEGMLDKFSHVSTGGGAMLEFLSGEKLPGIEALK